VTALARRPLPVGVLAGIAAAVAAAVVIRRRRHR
jgi:hypothetical protein